MSLLSFVIAKFPTLIDKTWEQIYLSGIALILAVIIGVPLGILAANTQKMKHSILAVCNVLQTIPSLALMAFLLPFLGIGIKPALITLAVYALLPIVQNTIAGLENVSPEIVEAADGLGFTSKQKLWMIELPLAVPTLIAGIRTATAMCVGIATIAAFIGAGGLGDFIYQGIALNDNRLVLLGAIPAALLALLLDYAIARLENLFNHRKWNRIKFKTNLAIIIVFLIFIAGGFLLRYEKNYLSHNNISTIRIASKNFTEQYILAYLIADMISDKTQLNVDEKFNLGTTAICQAAMMRGDIDIYPEYTGTAYSTILNLTNPGTAQEVYQTVSENYLKKYQIVWLPPFGFNDTQALAVRENFAKQHHLKTISDLAAIAPELTIGVPAEFIQRQDAFLGLQQKYHLMFGHIKQMDPGLMYSAIQNHDVDVIMAFSTDGRIAKEHLFLLDDDKHLFPPYYAAPLIRENILKQHPELLTALKALAGLIDEKTMQQLNGDVDIKKQAPEVVARNFLLQKGLIKAEK